MTTYDYLKTNKPTERVGRGLDILCPAVMLQVQIGDIIRVENHQEFIGIAHVIKASDTEVEVGVNGLFMVFNLEDTAEWDDYGYTLRTD